MTATQGFKGKIEAEDTEIVGAYDVSFDASAEELDDFEFDDEFFGRVQGLKDVTFSVSYRVDPDESSQNDLWDDWLNGDNVKVTFTPDRDGSRDYECDCMITSISESAAADGQIEGTVEFAIASGSLTIS